MFSGRPPLPLLVTALVWCCALRGLAAEEPPSFDSLPAKHLLVTFREGFEVNHRWPSDDEIPPAETARWLAGTFVFPRLPLRYDEWGIRQSWSDAVLVRAAADVWLRPGRRQFLLRARGLSRLWVNGVVIARTRQLRGSADGHEAVPPVPKPPLPGLRPVGYGDQEAFGEAEIGADGSCRVILESIVGGKQFRAEPGEMCVAVRCENGETFHLLQTENSGFGEPLTDAGWTAAAERAETALTQLDDETRRTAAASQNDFWAHRHEFARAWAAAHPGPRVPMNPASAGHPLDAFLADKIERAVAAAASSNTEEARYFHSAVLPILRELR